MNWIIEAAINMSYQIQMFNKTAAELERELMHTPNTMTQIEINQARKENNEAHEDLMEHFSK